MKQVSDPNLGAPILPGWAFVEVSSQRLHAAQRGVSIPPRQAFRSAYSALAPAAAPSRLCHHRLHRSTRRGFSIQTP